ncbi:MAG TPA: Wzz/FepE/Etk N-terminal domain-containing protein [Chryseolinea sp.]
MDLQTLFRVLWRKRWILIIIPLLSVGGAFLIRMLGEWKYRSSAQMATGITITDELIDNSGKYFNPYEMQITFTNLIEQIKSRVVLSQVSYRLLLRDLEGKEMPFRKPSQSKMEELANVDINSHKAEFEKILNEKLESQTLLDLTDPKQKLVKKVMDVYGYNYEALNEELAINRINISDYIEISYSSESPYLSAYVVNTLCSEFIRYYTNIKLSRSNVSLESLQSIVDQRKQYLDEKTEGLKNFQSNHEMINSEAEGASKIRQIQDYEDQIADEQKSIRGNELTLANLEMKIEQADRSQGNKPNSRIVDLRKKINTFNERYVAGGQTDQILLDSITAFRNQLQGMMNAAGEATKLTPAELNTLKDKRDQTKIDLEISRENLVSLNNILSSIRYSVGNFASREAVSQAIAKEVEVAREEYLAAQTRFNEAREKLVTNKMPIKQVVVGEVAEKPESRKTIVFMVFTGVLSFGLCAFVIILLEMLDTRIKTPQRFKNLAKMPLAGILEQLPKNGGAPNWNFFTPANESQELNRLNHDLRKIRYEIENRKVQVILVTSTKKAQGKTFSIMSLAYSLGLIHKRTLIIDTNMRNNSLTTMLTARFSLKQLMEYYNKNTKLIGTAKHSETKDPETNLITPTTNPMVDIIGNKMSQLSPSEIIPGGDFKVLLEWLKVQYDYIILEGAGLNEFSDSRELVRFVDLVIPVFSADSSITEEDKESLNFLKSLQNKLGPAVLNNVPKEEKS